MIDVSPGSPPNSTLTVATLNLLNDLVVWHDRGPLIVEELRMLQPDLIALQEVVLPANNAQWIADQLDGYTVYLSPKTGRRGSYEALAILSRLPVEAHVTLPLPTQNRVAQRVSVRHGQTDWVFANTHLYWHPFDDKTRQNQARHILDWLPRDRPTIVCGDFNAEPHYSSIATMHRRFASAHTRANGREPIYTCPTPLHRGPGPRHAARRAALLMLGLLSRRGHSHWRGTLDYIFVDPGVEVQRCEVAFQRHAPNNPQIYPSDHLGLTATLQHPDA